MRGEEVAKVVGGELIGEPARIKGFHFDSRAISPGELFVPVRGKRDGHDFIPDAFSKGAAGALTEKELFPPPGKFLIKVGNTLEAFKKVAAYRRELFTGTVVGITGSVGKSTTKELLHHLTSPYLPSYRNLKSYNNEIGLTYTLSNLPLSAKVYFQEVGTNSPGEVGELKNLLKPNLAVITAVELAHAEGFGSYEKIVEEKFSLTEGVDVAVVPHHLKGHSKARETLTFGFKEGDARLEEVELSPEGASFTVNLFGKNHSFFTPVPGHSVVNATLISLLVGRLLGLPVSDFTELLPSFTPPEGRLKVEEFGNTCLIDDSYNANPASVKNALKVLSLYPFHRVAVLGDMLELGSYSKEEHRKVGELLNSLGIETLITFGKDSYETYRAFRGEKLHFTGKKELLNFFKEFPLEGKAILVKGSRGNRLEEVCQIIRERLKR
jgi:UDP-N-acetylmuramoyl-tripeptide--D-alanyl-D-alanine ligase